MRTCIEIDLSKVFLENIFLDEDEYIWKEMFDYDHVKFLYFYFFEDGNTITSFRNHKLAHGLGEVKYGRSLHGGLVLMQTSH